MIIASIDIGTNTVLLLVAEVEPVTKNIIPLKNLYKLPRIGKGLKPGMSVSAEKIELLTEILSDYKKTADEYGCEKIIATATNAFRIASNSGEIISMIKDKLNINIEVIPGENEAVYSFLGATGGQRNSERTLVIDIGGGSTEIVYGTAEKIIYNKSFATGVVSATESFFVHAPPTPKDISELDQHITGIFHELVHEDFNIDKAVAIAGTPTTLACIKMNLSEFNEDLIEGSTISYDELVSLINKLKELTPGQILSNFKTIVKGREDILLSGSYILLVLMGILELDEVMVSTKGIRYGAIVNYFDNII